MAFASSACAETLARALNVPPNARGAARLSPVRGAHSFRWKLHGDELNFLSSTPLKGKGKLSQRVVAGFSIRRSLAMLG